MIKAELRITYAPDDEWLGVLDAVVKSGAFSGRGAAWFDRETLKTGFVRALRAFPISATDPPMIEGGFWNKDKPILDQRHLGIAITPYNSRGSLLVRVDLMTEFHESSENDHRQSVTARFLTEYAALDPFASHLEQVLDGRRDVALLAGEAIR
jgi:hypothetical protein